MRHFFSTVAFAALVVWAVESSAAVVFVTTSADLSGANSSRATPVGGSPGGLTGQGNWAAGGITLDWSISFNAGTGKWDYSYTFTQTAPSQGGISHWVIELTETLGATYWTGVFSDASTSLTGVSSFEVNNYTPDAPNTGDQPGMPADLFGVKFNVPSSSDSSTSSSVSFSIVQAPVWGDFYAKDGKAGNPGQGDEKLVNAVWNSGFSEGALTDQGGPAAPPDPLPAGYFNPWIPRPDGVGVGDPPPPPQTEVPEPASLIIWSLLISGVGLAALRRRKLG